jgi:inorganic pyrophosphatase
MSLHNVTPGAKAPDEFNVIIEIPMNADPIKYEVDEESGALFVDRFMATAMHYPCNYGYIPQTLADDGDPVDVLVITPVPLIPGRGGDLPAAGRAEDGRRGRRRQQAAGGADRQDPVDLFAVAEATEDLNPMRLQAPSSTSSSTTRTSKKASGSRCWAGKALPARRREGRSCGPGSSR